MATPGGCSLFGNHLHEAVLLNALTDGVEYERRATDHPRVGGQHDHGLLLPEESEHLVKSGALESVNLQGAIEVLVDSADVPDGLNDVPAESESVGFAASGQLVERTLSGLVIRCPQIDHHSGSRHGRHPSISKMKSAQRTSSHGQAAPQYSQIPWLCGAWMMSVWPAGTRHWSKWSGASSLGIIECHSAVRRLELGLFWTWLL